jgi:hypothetical protein
MWREDLQAFYDWRTSPEGEAFTARIAPNGEDAVLNHFVLLTGRDTWHPVPSICDHDVEIASSYDNDEHGHRRPCVTWHDYAADELSRPDFWLATALNRACCLCTKRPALRGSQVTGMGLCGLCLHETLGSIVSDYERGRQKQASRGEVRGDD